MITELESLTPERIREFRRINVVGTSGSGKSTFAREGAKALDLPYIELDQVFWGRDWREPSNAEFFPKVEQITETEAWVLDGNYTRTIPIKWPRTQLVIWLDLPFALTVARVTRRAISRSFSREEIWPGTNNRETLARSFLSRKSIIWWAISNYRKNRTKYAKHMASTEHGSLLFLRLGSRAEVAACLRKFRAVGEGATARAMGSVEE